MENKAGGKRPEADCRGMTGRCHPSRKATVAQEQPPSIQKNPKSLEKGREWGNTTLVILCHFPVKRLGDELMTALIVVLVDQVWSSLC